jgi:hypothetical protein
VGKPEASSDAYTDLVGAQLREGERRSPIYRAISPNPDPGSAFLSYPALPLLWLWRSIAHKRSHQKVMRSSTFPVARRMLLVPTGTRLLVWSARRGFKPGDFLGDIASDRIVGAVSPTVGQGWRTVVIEMVDGDPVSIKLSASAVDRFIADLTQVAR